MTAALSIDLNRQGPHSIEVSDSDFQTTGPFEIVLENHGESLHVHLNILDDELADVVSLPAVNHFIEAEDTRRITVDVAPSPRPVSGKLKVATRYGSEVSYVDLNLIEPTEEPDRVIVDDRLSKPQPADSAGADRSLDLTAWLADLPVAVIALVVVAVLIAGYAATAIESTVVTVGVIIVLAGVTLALGLLFR
ncbi:MAG: hypothetical protein SVG88_06365 [Halobacteriales archaeon]|nr:hypothetical protein [Halobacteriales archaeon]